MNKQNGFTLIEALVYLALFAIIIGGVVAAVYNIILSTDKTQAQVVLQQEANFLLRKIDWAISGSSAIANPTAGNSDSSLELTKSAGNISFKLPVGGVKLQINEGIGFTDLNNDNINLSAPTALFQHVAAVGGKPEAVITTFTLSDNYGHTQIFTATKYLRK